MKKVNLLLYALVFGGALISMQGQASETKQIQDKVFGLMGKEHAARRNLEKVETLTKQLKDFREQVIKYTGDKKNEKVFFDYVASAAEKLLPIANEQVYNKKNFTETIDGKEYYIAEHRDKAIAELYYTIITIIFAAITHLQKTKNFCVGAKSGNLEKLIHFIKATSNIVPL